MELTKTIYKNGEKVNTIKYTDRDADIELFNFLLNNINKRYKTTIKKDHIQKTITGSQTTTTENYDNSITKYKVEFVFTNVDPRIDLFY